MQAGQVVLRHVRLGNVGDVRLDADQEPQVLAGARIHCHHQASKVDKIQEQLAALPSIDDDLGEGLSSHATSSESSKFLGLQQAVAVEDAAVPADNLIPLVAGEHLELVGDRDEGAILPPGVAHRDAELALLGHRLDRLFDASLANDIGCHLVYLRALPAEGVFAHQLLQVTVPGEVRPHGDLLREVIDVHVDIVVILTLPRV
mmetsp:Transcript_102850/g.300049  ORF Transcript_102850/g.300049 Transcript_102850/m.300049 type:complete len:203 (-) Transcript_102850:65-673(-)